MNNNFPAVPSESVNVTMLISIERYKFCVRLGIKQNFGNIGSPVMPDIARKCKISISLVPLDLCYQMNVDGSISFVFPLFKW